MTGLRPLKATDKLTDETKLSQCVIANKKCVFAIGTLASTMETIKTVQADAKETASFNADEDHYEWITEQMNNEIKETEHRVDKASRAHLHKSPATLKPAERKAMVEYACMAGKIDLLKYTSLLGGKGEEAVDAVQALCYCAMLQRSIIFGYILAHDKAQGKRAMDMGLEHKTRLLGKMGKDEGYGYTYSHFDTKELAYVVTACKYGRLEFVKMVLSDTIPNDAWTGTETTEVKINGFRSVLYPLGVAFWRQCIKASIEGGHLKQTKWLLNEAKKNLPLSSSRGEGEEKLLVADDLLLAVKRGYVGHVELLVSKGFLVTFEILLAAANLFIQESERKVPRQVCLNLLKFLASKTTPKMMRELMDHIVAQVAPAVGTREHGIVLANTVDLLELLAHPAGGNVSIDAALIDGKDFKSQLEWSAESSKHVYIFQYAVTAHCRKRAAEKHKCRHLLAPPGYFEEKKGKEGERREGGEIRSNIPRRRKGWIDHTGE